MVHGVNTQLVGGPLSDMELTVPNFTPAPGPAYENNILFGVRNSNGDGETEIYRSLTPGSGFVLIATLGAGEIAHYDRDLAPRTTFYYKLRAVLGDEYSDFSSVGVYASGSKFYYPTLAAETIDAHKIKVTVTDNSYDDIWYEVFRDEGPHPGLIRSVTASDSGQVTEFIDEGLVPGTYYHYRVDAHTMGANSPLYQGVAGASATTEDALLPPEFTHQLPPEFFCGSIINFEFNNPNDGALTEIYRSLDSDTGFGLIATSGTTYFVDDVNPHTTYYYKLRAIKDGQTSEFSETEAITSLSDYYNPTLAASPASSGVELALTDNSFADISYGIIRNEVGTDNWVDIGARIELADSGQTYYVNDESVVFGNTYAYYVDVIVNCDGFPQYYEVASDTVTAEGTLIPPSFDPYNSGYMPCGNQITFSVNDPNIGTATEIYRSLQPGSGFELIHTLPISGSYLDENLVSNTTYYYKLRAVAPHATSEFSNVVALTSGFAFHNPLLTATVLPDNTVKLWFQDRSYLDNRYEIYGVGEGTTFVDGVVSSDSGSVHEFIDSSVIPGNTYIYYVNAELLCDGLPVLSNVAIDTVTIPANLQAPYFEPGIPPSNEPCGNQVAFSFTNPNATSNTQVWRSTSQDAGFELITTLGPDASDYLDQNLASRKTYYYKLRAVEDGAASPFSETMAFMSDAQWFNPGLTTTVLPDNTVEVQFQDRSYLDQSYEIYSVEAGHTDMIFSTGVSALDSGSIHTFIDSSVVPGKTYIYYVNATLNNNCGAAYLSNVAIDTASIPNVPYISGFTLVDTQLDIDIRDLHDYDTINGTHKPSIRANTNKITSAVAFYVNGKKINTDNTPPFVIYGDAHGNYNPGKLKPGDYTFMAIPYTANNGGGTAGRPLTIHFTVVNDPAPAALAFSENSRSEISDGVRFFPNPMVSQATLEISSVPESKVKVVILDQRGNVLHTVFAGRLNEEGYFKKELDREQFQKGIYLMAVTMNGATSINRFVVE
jgi:hypothetical protein